MSQHFALFDNNVDIDESGSLLLSQPVAFIECVALDDVPQAFADMARYQSLGYFIAGYFAYEFAGYFNFDIKDNFGEPYFVLGVFKTCELLTDSQVDQFIAELESGESAYIEDLQFGLNSTEYQKAIKNIHRELIAGNSYQVNYTFQTYCKLTGNSVDFYRKLRASQPVKYGAYLHFPNKTILSRSPELFFKKQGAKLTVRPMKGTARRYLADTAKDYASKNELKNDAKQVSENVMIVDLLRNDLGVIADAGSVSVDSLFELETYPTVHQMVSEISCQIAREMPLFQILQALFPCGSVTGVPKKRTMEIINRLEPSPRGVYTGAIGYLLPDNNMCFNVPIRTLELDRDNAGKMGIGSGVVLESSAVAEFEECWLKAQFLLAP